MIEQSVLPNVEVGPLNLRKVLRLRVEWRVSPSRESTRNENVHYNSFNR